MDATTRSMLNEAEQALLREATDRRLAKLDEDALIDLHGRIRRARTKYLTQLRRRGAAQVSADRSRTRAAGSVSRAAVKAEAFEEALSRVSLQLGRVAAETARELKEQRLAAAAAAAPPRRGRTAGKGVQPKSTPGKSARRTPIEQKRRASTRSTKQRSQARRDAKR